MSELSTLEREQLYSIDIYPKRELTVVRGEGAHVYDDTGREFIDCAAGIGVASVGHANPAVAKAVAEQERRGFRLQAFLVIPLQAVPTLEHLLPPVTGFAAVAVPVLQLE